MKKKPIDELFDFLKHFISFITTIVGFISAVFGLYNLWQGNRDVIVYAALGTGSAMIIASLIYIAFKRQENIENVPFGEPIVIKTPYYPKLYKVAYVGLAICVLGGIFYGYLFDKQQKKLESKIVILVTNISGPSPENYGVTEELITQLRKELAEYDDTIVVATSEAITVQQGSEYARDLGRNHTADIVLWGWYHVTDSDVRLTLNVENINSEQFSVLGLGTSNTLQAQTAVADINSFSLQQSIGGKTSALMLFLRGFARKQSGDIIGALDSLDKAISHLEWGDEFVGKSIVYFYRANIYYAQGQYDNAIEDYDQAILLDPRFLLAYNNRCVSFTNIGKPDKAIEDCTRAIKINPAISAIYYNRGGAYEEMGEIDKAITDYTKAIELDPNKAANYNNRGFAYEKIGEFEKSIDDYTKVIELDPVNVAAYAHRGGNNEKIGETEKAINDYTKVVELAPELYTFYILRGMAYEKIGETEKAKNDYSHVIQIAPVNAEDYYDRASAYNSLGESEKAIIDYSQAIQLNPEYATAYYERANMYSNMGDHDKALADFDQAIQIDPEDGFAYYWRGSEYGKLGEYKKAIEDLNYALTLMQDANIREMVQKDLNAIMEKAAASPIQ